MKMYLISDNIDTWTGMRLAGVDVVADQIHFHYSLPRIIKEMIRPYRHTPSAREFPEIIDNVKLERRLPLIVEIPDRHGTGRKPDFITSYVNEAIGLKL